ncbi:hypothetical protein E2493_19915 [Sphingomonas parva]|uniref:Uncharacterized protein n=1 Tax=Sphingomonas parva TaxID=2555898 RepID=A0A4Y8ZPV0_9SPHN|nr:hypothetical protein [Sphingomonas parva]TFI56496.1 hypothetical protein E2493_19915 [Sphingomonas parva]
MRSAHSALVLAAVFGCAQPGAGASPAADWCASGAIPRDMSAWTSIPRANVTFVAIEHQARAVARLQERSHVRISAAEAAALTGSALSGARGEAFLLARAGLLAAPEVSTRDHVAGADGRLNFVAEMSPGRKALLIYTQQMVPPYPSRQVALVVRAPSTVRNVASRCLAVR